MWETLLVDLSAQRLETLRKPNLGPLELDEIVGHIDFVAEVARVLDVQGNRYLPKDLEAAVAASLQTVIGLADEMGSFTGTDVDAPSVRAEYNRRALAEAETIKARAVPYMGAGRDTASATVELGRLLEESRAATTEIAGLLGASKARASAAVASQLSAFYSGQAIRHSRWSLGFLAVAITLAVITGLAGAWALVNPVQPTTTSIDPWVAYVEAVAPRVFLFGLVLYAMRFALKNYSANRHLQVVNEQKRIALDTYPLLVGALTDATVRDQVLLEVVRSIVASSETGFVPAAANPLVENEVGIPLITQR